MSTPNAVHPADNKPDTDCLSCRLTGASALLGLSAYTYYTGTTHLRSQRASIMNSSSSSGSRLGFRARRGGVLGLSATVAALGLWRLVN